jgi:hypothetical protein
MCAPISLADTDYHSRTYTAIQSGEIEIKGTQLPRFMYAENFNPEDLDEGLLQGHTLRAVRSLTLLFFL